MITKTFEIASGVRLNYIQTDKFKTNYFSFNFITSVNKEKAPYHTMIPRILTHGSATYPSQSEIDKRLQFLYSGTIGVRNMTSGKFHIFGLIGNMLNDKYTLGTPVTDEMINLLNDVVFNPYLENGAFSEEYTEDEKLELIDQINAEINNKTSYSLDRCTEIMCENEIFSIKKTGRVEDVAKITPNLLYQAYKTALETYKIEIYVVGNVDIEKIAHKFKTQFEKINRTTEKIIDIEIVRSASEVKRIIEVQDVNQGKLCMGFRTGKTIEDGNFHVAQMFNEIYGSSPTSKLFVNVREKKSLCYTCRSMLTQKNGIMFVIAGIEPTNKQVAEDAILEQLDEMKNKKISDTELESAKKSLKNAYMNIYDSPAGMELWTLNRGLSGNFDIPNGEAKKLDSVTKEQISEFASGITLDTVYFLKGEDDNG